MPSADRLRLSAPGEAYGLTDALYELFNVLSASEEFSTPFYGDRMDCILTTITSPNGAKLRVKVSVAEPSDEEKADMDGEDEQA